MGIFHEDSIPVGFGMGLAMNMDAMDRFSHMSEAEKEELLNRARDAKSKSEMQGVIDSISRDII